MYIIGYCTRCHKIKRVRITGFRPGGTQLGICRECESRRAAA